MLQWRLPTDITPEQAGILENKIYPKLSSAILSLINELLKNGTHIEYMRMKRQLFYEELLIKQKLTEVKGYQDLGSDYDSASDDESKRIKNQITDYECNNSNFVQELLKVKESESLQDKLDRLEREKKNKKSKQIIESMKSSGAGLKLMPVENENDENENKVEQEKSVKYSDSDEEENTSQRVEKHPPFNPLKYLSEQLKKNKEIKND